MKIFKNIKNKIINYYKTASIQSIISLSFTIVAVSGMLIVLGTFYLRFTVATEEMVSKNNETILEQVNLNLDSYLRRIMKISDTIYYKAIKKSDLATEDINKEMDLIYEANRDYLISISLFSDYGEILASYPVKQLKDNLDPRENDWFKVAVNKRENLHFSTPHVQNLFYDLNYKYTWVVSLSRAVEITENSKIKSGVLLVDMNFSGIEQIFDNVDVGQNGYIYLIDSNGEIIVVSQFTLHAATKKGNRPSYIKAAKPDIAIPLYEAFVKQMQIGLGKKIQTGQFGADMKVSLIHDGPVTILIDTKNKD